MEDTYKVDHADGDEHVADCAACHPYLTIRELKLEFPEI